MDFWEFALAVVVIWGMVRIISMFLCGRGCCGWHGRAEQKARRMRGKHDREGLMVGGLVTLLLGIAFVGWGWYSPAQTWSTFPGLILSAIGIALIVSYALVGKRER